MFKNLSLAKKLGGGFGILILIAVFLGGMAVYNMKGVEGESQKLAKEYVPEVKVASDLSGASNRVMYEMRGYGFTEDKSFYDAGIEQLDAVDTHLAAAKKLSEEAKNLKALKEHVKVAQSAVDEYKKLVQKTVELNKAMAAARNGLNENAAKYMKNSADFLDNQNAAFKADLADRQEKVKLVTDIVSIGTKSRVYNFRAQATGNYEFMEDAVTNLQKAFGKTSKLRSITTDAEDIKRIDETEAAAKGYAEGMKEFLQVNEDLDKYRKEMDESAAAYMKNCNSFLAGQNEKMKSEFSTQGANLNERLEKITIVNDIIDLGNAARVLNFKSQATGNPEFMKDAIAAVGKVNGKTSALRKITRDSEYIKRIDETEAAAKTYKSAMESFLKEYLSLAEVRKSMDENAGKYVANCDKFSKVSRRNLLLIWESDMIK